MRRTVLLILSGLLVSCQTPVYKHFYEVRPEMKRICRYKKISDLQKQKVACYKINDKLEDGKYRFEEVLVISKRRFREILHEKLNEVFGD